MLFKVVLNFSSIWRYFSLLGILHKYWRTGSNAHNRKLMEKLFHQCRCKRTQLRVCSVWILVVLTEDDSIGDDSVMDKLPMSCHIQQYIFVCSCLMLFPLK